MAIPPKTDILVPFHFCMSQTFSNVFLFGPTKKFASVF